jgi:NADPH:quinone reductase-like Zn-dependent oxidoreductase
VKAITVHRYGPPDVLEFQEVDDPVVGDGEVLVRVHAASANPRDWHFMRGLPYVVRPQFGLRRPRHQGLGSDVAGRVEAVGRDVARFRPGDEVFADVVRGGFAEYVCAPEGVWAPKPVNLSFEQAAAVPLAAVTALQGLRDHGRLRPGQQVLVVGAAGGVGSFAVQLARSFGAEVTGVCSTGKAELVRSLGADQVIDYTREDFTRAGRRWDLVFQLAGTRSPWDCRRALTPRGTLLVSSGEGPGRLIGPLARIAATVALAPLVRQRLVPFVARQRLDDLLVMKELIEAGTVRPVVGRTFPLSDVPAAIRHLEEGHALGKIVITV